MFNINLLGNDEILHNLLYCASNNKLHNSLIFSGSKGIGKFSYAKLFVSVVLSYDANQLPKNIYDLEVDGAMQSLIDANSCSNLLLIQPEFDVKNQKFKELITIEEVRKINDFVHKSTANSKPRFIIIDALDNLNLNSSNALLKNLEEPSNNTFFILISHNSKNMLDTIASRCITYNFKSLSPKDLKKLSAKFSLPIDANKLDKLIDISLGSWEKLQFLSKVDNLNAYITLNELLTMQNNPHRDKKIYDYVAMLKSTNYNNYDFLLDMIYDAKLTSNSINPYVKTTLLKNMAQMKKNLHTLNLDKNMVLLNLLFNY